MEVSKKPRSFRKIIFLILFIFFLFVLNKFSSIILGISFVSLLSDLPVISHVGKYICAVEGGSWEKNYFTDGNKCYFSGEPVMKKPVIYLYPQEKKTITVKVSLKAGFSVTYPSYRNGWTVIAEPSGKLIDSYDGKEYSYLYWESNPDRDAKYDLSTGFVVKGTETAEFLQNKLAELGLIPKEYNEFIVYWLPKMNSNSYNLIHFATKEEYDERVIMEVQPKPDSLLRIFMVYKPLDKFIDIKPQTFPVFQRQGFSVVEWGGTELLR